MAVTYKVEQAPAAIGGVPINAAAFFDDFTTANISWQGFSSSFPNATPGSGSIVLNGQTWTITTGFVVQLNGANTSATDIANIYNVNGTIWAVTYFQNWSSWNGTAWVTGPRPIPYSWIDHYPFGGNEYFLPASNEEEYLCDIGTGQVSSTGYQPFSVSNSVLSIKAQSVTGSGKTNPAGQPWNSGILTSCTENSGEPTAGLFSFQYGYVEIRCQCPAGGPTNLNSPGFWSVFVLYPLAAGSGEIDIFEVLGGSPNVVRQTTHSSTSSANASFSPTASISTGFHTVGVDWQADFTTFYVDGVQTGQITTPSDFKQPYYINCGLAVAGPNAWVGTPLNTQLVDPGFLQIDYIGVWQSFSAYQAAQQAPSGPWTPVAGSPFSVLTDTVTGLQPQTSYFFRITAQDLTLGITASPTVVGPITTLSSSQESPAGTNVQNTTTIINASPTPGTAANPTGPFTTFQLTSGGQILRNGAVDSNTALVTRLYYTGHTTYQEAGNSNGTIQPGWWADTGVSNGYTPTGSPLPQNEVIAISTIAQQSVNASFTVSGTLQNYPATLSPANLQYLDTIGGVAGTWTNLPTGSNVTQTTFVFNHPALASPASSMTVALRDLDNQAITATSNTFAVINVTTGAPGLVQNFASPNQSSSTITLTWDPPTSGGALDHGVYQVSFKAATAQNFAAGPSVPYATQGSGSFSDGLGHTISLNTAGQIVVNGSPDTTTINATLILLLGSTLWQFVPATANGTGWYSEPIPPAPGAWTGPVSVSPLDTVGVTIISLSPSTSYNFEITVSNSSGTSPVAPSGAPLTVATTAISSTANFSVKSGQILDPNGNVWRGCGVNTAADFQSWGNFGLGSSITNTTNCTPLLTAFPKTKIVRINCYDILGAISDPKTIDTYVTALTGKKIVCSIEYHLVGMTTPSPNTSPTLAQVITWYTNFAKHYANNNYVWWEIPNEINPYPDNDSGTKLSNCVQGVVNAIRAQSGQIIQIMMEDGTITGGAYTAIPNTFWSAQTNIIMNGHFYAGSPQFPWTGTTLQQAQANVLSKVKNLQVIQSKDGVLPVVNGEYGDSTDGQNVDANVQNLVAAGTTVDGTIAGLYGSTAWFMNFAAAQAGALEDCLLLGPNFGTSGLTTYGTTVANNMF